MGEILYNLHTNVKQMLLSISVAGYGIFSSNNLCSSKSKYKIKYNMHIKLPPKKKHGFQGFCNYCKNPNNFRVNRIILPYTLMALFLMAELCVNYQFSFAQNLIEITGTVTEQETGQPLTGVTIILIGTDQGTTTDLEGKYSINVPDGDGTLRFSFIGFQSQEVPIQGRRTINVALEPSILLGDEVVVTGYSQQQRRDFTGSIAVVEMDNFERLSASGDLVTKQLQGAASGVNVTSSGQPGESPNIRIRGINTFGDNTPLYIVDGVSIENIDDLNPNDIESIQVLKDASSAAVYGARAANGVIVVTTKKGRGSVQFNYNGSFGVDWQGRDNPWDIATPQQHADLLWIATDRINNPRPHPLYGDGTSPVLPDFIAPVGASEGDVDFDSYFVIPEFNDPALLNDFVRITRANKQGTDWFSELFSAELQQNHNVSVSGGSPIGNYLFSVNFTDQEGTLLRTGRKRYNFRANTSFNVGDKIRIGENLSYNVSENPQVASLTEGSAIGMAFRQQPIIPVLDIRGNFAGAFGAPLGNAFNPVGIMERTRNNEQNNRRLIGNVFGEVDLTQKVVVRTSFGGELINNSSQAFQFPTFENQENDVTNVLTTNEINAFNWTFTSTVKYNDNYKKHDYEVLFGTEIFKNSFTFRGATADGFFSFDKNFVNLSNASGNRNTFGSDFQNTLASFFGRIDYSFDDKYLLSGTVRHDGSSRFSEGNRWGTFPSGSVGWRISSEPFFKDLNLNFLNEFRIKTSVGLIGNEQNVPTTNQFTLFASDRASSFFAINGSNSTTQEGFLLSQIGNPNAQWEEVLNVNVGFVTSLFANRVDVDFEWYWKDVSDLLFNPELPGTAGSATAPFVNIANMRNTGIDVSLSSFHNITDDLQISGNINFTSFNNEITKVADGVTSFSQESRRFVGQNFVRNEVGQPVSSFFGFVVDGFFQNEEEIDQLNAGAPSGEYQTEAGVGRFRFRDINGDGEITPDDRTFIGDPNPDFTMGLDLGLNYKNWDFSMFWFTSQGNDIWNQVRWWTDFFPSFNGAKSTRTLTDAFVPGQDNSNATLPIQENVGTFSTNGSPSSFFVEDGSYWRLRNLTLGYSVPQSFKDRFGIGNLRVFVQVNNVLTITDYTGPDPEIGFFPGDGGGGSTNFGIDEGQFPTPKQFLFGVNLSIL